MVLGLDVFDLGFHVVGLALDAIMDLGLDVRLDVLLDGGAARATVGVGLTAYLIRGAALDVRLINSQVA